MPFSPVYAAVKAGVVMFCRSIDEGLRDNWAAPIAVRAFCPQFVETSFVSTVMSDLSRRAAGTPMGTHQHGPGCHESSAKTSSHSPSLLASVSPQELIGSTGGRLLTVIEAADAAVALLIDPGPSPEPQLPSCALLLTTRGPRWWKFPGGPANPRGNSTSSSKQLGNKGTGSDGKPQSRL